MPNKLPRYVAAFAVRCLEYGMSVEQDIAASRVNLRIHECMLPLGEELLHDLPCKPREFADIVWAAWRAAWKTYREERGIRPGAAMPHIPMLATLHTIEDPETPHTVGYRVVMEEARR